jgi:hypothetical protein
MRHHCFNRFFARAGLSQQAIAKVDAVSRSRPAVRLIFAILLTMLSESASAELRVIAAEGVDVAVGAEFPDDHVFDMPDNGKLVIDHSTYKARYWMAGPYKGTLENYIAECHAESRRSKHCGGTDR